MIERRFEIVLEYLQQKDYRPMKQENLLQVLSKKDESVQEWAKILAVMEKDGMVVKSQSGKVGLPHQMGFSVGRLQMHPKGFGFLIPEDDRDDVYIERDQVSGAMHSDRVLVRLIGKDPMGRRSEGEIVRVLKRANDTLVGTFHRTQDYGFVIPDNPRILDHILISAPNVKQAQQGDKVLIKMLSWPEEHRLPEGQIMQVMGQAGEEIVERTAVLMKNGIHEQFPESVIVETDGMKMDLPSDDSRLDLRDLLTVTIDGEDAKDLDDAVSLEECDDGCLRLGVHIADVSHYVRAGTPTDAEAMKRGTSVYLVGHVVPMLPARLSNDLCSLNANEDKLTLSVLMELDEKANIKSYQIAPSICRIDRRLTYERVTAILDGLGQNGQGADLVEQMLQKLNGVSQRLRENRFRSGSIDFDLPETKVILDESGKTVDIRKAERLQAHSLIEECMLLANRVVAEHLKKNKIPGIFRIHEPPNETAYEELKSLLKGFGIDIKGKRSGSVMAIQKILEESYARQDGPVIRRVVLQAMERARYAPESMGHYGLGFRNYTHFTSPIRRYPDLIVHRMVKEERIPREESDQSNLHKRMTEIANSSSMTERAAAEAENEWLDRKKAEFMLDHVGDEFPGIISGITGFGMFVELENTCEGLVHISNMADDYYEYDEKRMSLKGRSTRREFKIGDHVLVQVTKADVANRQIDFSLVN